jgi:hypothetical protein
MFVSDKRSQSDKTAEIMAVPISSNASAVKLGYGWENSILPVVSCAVLRVAFYTEHPVFIPLITLESIHRHTTAIASGMTLLPYISECVDQCLAAFQ